MRNIMLKEIRLSSSPLAFLFIAFGLMFFLPGYPVLCGAFFMATDYATCPLSRLGRIIMGLGCGIFTFVIRAYANYPEGTSFAILFMNVLTPLIDRYTMPKFFGEVKKNA